MNDLNTTRDVADAKDIGRRLHPRSRPHPASQWRRRHRHRGGRHRVAVSIADAARRTDGPQPGTSGSMTTTTVSAPSRTLSWFAEDPVALGIEPSTATERS
jgi:hypothetical protein